MAGLSFHISYTQTYTHKYICVLERCVCTYKNVNVFLFLTQLYLKYDDF